MVELLSPAGDMKSFYSAITNGADAVYIGVGSFNARQKANNFSIVELKDMVFYAHLFNVKIFVAFNIMIKESEFMKAVDEVIKIWAAGIDAVIVQDFGLLCYIKKNHPKIVVHASTQMGINNLEGAQLLEDLGADRVILSRETEIREIERIKNKTSLEVECFCHGALCVSFSGNCYLSSVASGFSGNRGLCMQLCRKKYELCDENNITKSEGYLLSLKDLCVRDRIEDFINAGVDCLKIEGRLKSPQYVGAATALYRKVLDKIYNPDNKLKGTNDSEIEEDFLSVKTLFNRGEYTEGYAFNQKNEKLIYPFVQNNLGIYVGKVDKILGKDRVFINSTIIPKSESGYKFIKNHVEIGNAVFKNGLKISKNGFEVLTANNNVVGADVHLTSNLSLQEKYCGSKKLYPIKLLYDLKKGAKAKLKAEISGKVFEIHGNIVEEARTAPVLKEQINQHLSSIGSKFFAVSSIDGISDEDIFIPVSKLNELKRNLMSEVEKTLRDEMKRSESSRVMKDIKLKKEHFFKLAIFDEEIFNMLNIAKQFDVLVFSPRYSSSSCHEKFLDIEFGKKYLFIPSFATEADMRILENEAKRYDGIYANNVGGVYLAYKLNKPVIFGFFMNIANGYFKTMFDESSQHKDSFLVSLELTKGEIEEIKTVHGLNAYTLDFGYEKVMTLIHCPFLNCLNSKCNDCKYAEGYYYKDESGRKFRIYNHKIDSCRFYLINNSLRDSGNRQICDFSCFGSLTSEFEKIYNKQSDINLITTNRALKKGVK